MQGRRIVETGHFLQGMVFTGQDEEHDYYYDNGTFCSCAVKRIDGKREGPVTIQDRTGRVIAKLVYSNDSINGNCTRNFSDYKLVCDVKDNIMHGYYWKYDKNDNIIDQGEYDHGKQKIEGDDYDNVYSSGQFDNNQYTARHETNNRNNGYQKMEENATYHIKSAYYKEGKNYWLGYRASKMDVAGVISYFYRDSNKTPYADAYDYKNSYKSLNYTTSSDRLVALAKKYYKSGAVDEDITYGSTFYLN